MHNCTRIEMSQYIHRHKHIMQIHFKSSSTDSLGIDQYHLTPPPGMREQNYVELIYDIQKVTVLSDHHII